MIILTKIERDSIEILIKNLRWELRNAGGNAINYQVDRVDVNLIIKGLEKSLQIP